MIPRYSFPEIDDVWSEQFKLETLFKIEIHACRAMEALGKVPAGTADAILKKRNWREWDTARIGEIEKVTKHDVIAFLTYINENIGPDARFLHLGMTSSDVLDTCLSYQLKICNGIILRELEGVIASLKRRAIETKKLLCMGRSHGIHAEPTTFGLKFLSYYLEFGRSYDRVVGAGEQAFMCAISGAVGTFSSIDPSVQKFVAGELGLMEEGVSTQVIPRDRHAGLFAVFGVLASSIERFAVEVRHSQRTEVYEMEEGFAVGQKGSSAMPHKRNPVLSENLTGLARMIRSAVVPIMENVVLWHERDISHSSVERVMMPDVTTLLAFALNRLRGVIDGLVIYPENALANINKMNGLHFSQQAMLTLVETGGMTREDAYAVVQRNAMKIWRKETDLNLRELIAQDDDAKGIFTPDILDRVFDASFFLKNVDHIFSKVL